MERLGKQVPAETVRIREWTMLSARAVSRSYKEDNRGNQVLLDPRANAELVPRLHVALHASHAALPMVTSKFRPNIALPTLAPILLMQPLQRHVYYIYTTKFR
jgi:hypothetical protein